jgi:hypothetical protein
MLVKLLQMILATGMALAGMQAKRSDTAALRSRRSFEVHITKAPRWKNACLQVSIDQVNRSSDPLFLPAMGFFIQSSAIYTTTGSEDRNKIQWYTVYGASDVFDLSATPLAPGMTVHGDYCVGPTFAVVNAKKKTRRQVPLRGKLRIYATYYASRQDWLSHKSQMEEMNNTPPSNWPKLPKVLQPKVVTVIVPIPCRESACNPDCDEPPTVLEGEGMVIPDMLSDEHEWNKRGEAITEELERKLSPCPEP